LGVLGRRKTQEKVGTGNCREWVPTEGAGGGACRKKKEKKAQGGGGEVGISRVTRGGPKRGASGYFGGLVTGRDTQEEGEKGRREKCREEILEKSISWHHVKKTDTCEEAQTQKNGKEGERRGIKRKRVRGSPTVPGWKVLSCK